MEKSHCSYVRSWAVLSMVQFASAYECKISVSSPPKVKGEFEKLLLVEVYSVCWTISPDMTELSLQISSAPCCSLMKSQTRSFIKLVLQFFSFASTL